MNPLSTRTRTVRLHLPRTVRVRVPSTVFRITKYEYEYEYLPQYVYNPQTYIPDKFEYPTWATQLAALYRCLF